MSVSSRITLFFLTFFTGSQCLQAHHLDTQHQSFYEHHETRTEKSVKRYKRKVTQAFEKYRKNTTKVWGKEAVMPDAKTSVTYRNHYRQRSIIDYEKGNVRVELALKQDHTHNNVSVHHQLEQAIEQAILQAPDDRSIIDIAEHPDPPDSDEPAELAGLVANDNGAPLTADQLEKFKKEKGGLFKHHIITGRDGKQRIVYSTQFDLVPDQIKRRAVRFRKAVDRNATLRRIPAPLIYAIIETESYFNPHARSPIPAFGLMQLIPEAGARDAYKFLYAKDKVVKEKYLYNPNNNIELGVAYLHLLYFRYFNTIRDPQSRQWATIAAYNSGYQNVIKSVIGKFDDSNHAPRWIWEKRAIDKINHMKPEQVYSYLCKNLPFGETRDYLKKVRRRMGKYQI